MAAAPELLEACESLALSLRHVHECHKPSDMAASESAAHMATVKAAFEVIDKAKGAKA
jgi:hypothetical protein